MRTVKWPGNALDARAELKGIVINVYPSPENNGFNVFLVARLLNHLGVCTKPEMEYNPEMLDGEGAIATMSLTDGTKLFVFDWHPKNRQWGGKSDNMLVIKPTNMSAKELSGWIVEFFHRNGHENAKMTLFEKDGSYDVTAPNLFVSFMFNVDPN